jgi:hypothetical protein
MFFNEKIRRKLWHTVFNILNRKLIIINTDYMGLGNRIKFLASYHVNYGLNNTTLFWNRQGWVNSSLKEIIKIEGIESFKEYPIFPSYIMVPIICHPSKSYFRERGYWRLDISRELPDDFYIERNGLKFPSIDFCYEKTPEWAIKIYSDFFCKVLKPTDAVRQRMAEIQVGFDDVCVQVRNSVDQKDTKDVSELSTVIKYMKTFPANKRFFISTLNAAISKVIIDVFGDRVIELPNKQYRSMIDATADMYLLSKGEYLVVSPGSSFAEVAWWLGGCCQKVVQLPAEIFPD